MFPVKGLISSRQKIGGPTSERKINSSIELMVGPNAQRGDVKRRYQMTSPRGGLERPRRIRISGTDGAYAVERRRDLAAVDEEGDLGKWRAATDDKAGEPRRWEPQEFHSLLHSAFKK